MKRIPAALSSWSLGKQLRWLRQYLNETQTEFWARFGVTQSQGSRFEQGTDMPAPVAILLALYLELKVSDADLVEARKQGLPTGGRDRSCLDRAHRRLPVSRHVELGQDVRLLEVDASFGSSEDARDFPR